ncbi:MAG: LysR family transcriptional regulator [Sneathiella sp.]|nr:LysR family transcriptional regulator [Sneathiella sp.]
MDRFRELSTFVAVAKHGGFNIAARELNMSPSTVTRMINTLEARLGANLLNRNTRQVTLTEAGQGLMTDAERILSDLSESEEAAAGAHKVPRGKLRITAPMLFGQKHIAPILRDYLDLYPEVSADLVFVDRLVDMIDEGFNIAVRIGDLSDSSFLAVRVGFIRLVLVASPEYLARHGAPKNLQELNDHRIVQFLGTHRSPEWRFVRDKNIQVVKINPSLTVNTAATSIKTAVEGWGIARIMSYQIYSEMANGTLVEFLHQWNKNELPVHLVYPAGRHTDAKTRTFINYAAQRIRQLKNLNYTN